MKGEGEGVGEGCLRLRSMEVMVLGRRCRLRNYNGVSNRRALELLESWNTPDLPGESFNGGSIPTASIIGVASSTRFQLRRLKR